MRNPRAEAGVSNCFCHDLSLYEPRSRHCHVRTATRKVIHYKARRYFLINALCNGDVGVVSTRACERHRDRGTWRDAEDGVLAMSAIAQGSVDSTIGLPVDLEAFGTATVLYWICAGKTYDEVRNLDTKVRQETAARVLSRTASYWYTWVNKPPDDLSDLPDEITDLYKRSLLVIRTHCDNGGAVVAANDSDIQWGHNDHYSYMWTRDASFVCDALDRAGFPEITRRFFLFAQRVIKDEGYFLHKYHPDGSVASLWHPWIRNGKPQLPIQEDETALVIWLVARHYERTRDLEFLRVLYQRLVLQPAEFLVRYRDPQSGLPLPSFDLWEERQGVFTFTCSAVFAGLTAAAQIANLLNDPERRDRYTAVADEIRQAMTKHLWLEDEGRFARGLVLRDDDQMELDKTVDSSTFAVFYLDVFPPTSATVTGTMAAIRERLWVQTEVGGVARYERDAYHRSGRDVARAGQSWLICTLWLAEHAIRKAQRSPSSVGPDTGRWARSKAPASLVLASRSILMTDNRCLLLH